MKAIQITVDEALLAQLDADEEVRRAGRSAVVRRLMADYLRRSKRVAVRDRYRAAYADGAGLETDFDGWEDQGQWPE